MRAAILISIYMLVAGVLLTGCKTQREYLQNSTQVSAQSDSVRYVERIVVDTIRIPRDTASIQLPFLICQDTLVGRDTIFEKRSGRATVRAKFENGMLKVYAECDSLEELVLHYEKLIERYKTASTNSTSDTTTNTQTGWPSFKVPLGANIALAGLGVLAIIWGIKMLRT